MEPTLSPLSDRLREAHDSLRRIAERRGLEDVLSGLDEAARRLRETTFRLAVLGEYKRGKSTLINALLGRPVLPMAVVPLTSIVTEVRYRVEPGVTIEFLDGRSAGATLDELAAYVTEPENPHNSKKVRRAIVHDPAAFLAEGVTVLDTPGVGSVFDHNTRLTYGTLEDSDAVIIVLAADQPLSAEERGLLRSLSDITDRILFVVNRADVLTPDELPTSLQFIRATLEESEGHPPELVFALSARRALAARLSGEQFPPDFERFSKALHRVLIERKSAILLDRAATITRRSADLLALRLDAEHQSSRLAASDLQRAIDQFRLASAQTAERLEQSVVLLKHQVSRLHSVELRGLGDARRDRLAAELWPPIEQELRSREAPRHRGWAEKLALEIGRRVVEELRPYYRESEVLVNAGFDSALEEHMNRVREAIRETVETANRLLGMRAEVPPAVAPLSERRGFYFKDWDGAGGQFVGSRWWFRLPRRWGERHVIRQFRELLYRRINQNLSAIHYDWVSRLDDAVRVFESSSRAQLAATQRMIADALAGAQSLRAERAADRLPDALSGDLEIVRSLSRMLSTPVATDGCSGRPSHVPPS